jgi:hypothetical protein
MLTAATTPPIYATDAAGRYDEDAAARLCEQFDAALGERAVSRWDVFAARCRQRGVPRGVSVHMTAPPQIWAARHPEQCSGVRARHKGARTVRDLPLTASKTARVAGLQCRDLLPQTLPPSALR